MVDLALTALDAMARRLYGWTKGEAQAAREYELSGLCPGCWAELFPPEDAS